MKGQRLESLQVFELRESHDVRSGGQETALSSTTKLTSYAQLDLNTPKWTPMEPVRKCTFGFYNARSTWEPAAGKVCQKLKKLAPQSEEVIEARELIEVAVIKRKRD